MSRCPRTMRGRQRRVTDRRLTHLNVAAVCARIRLRSFSVVYERAASISAIKEWREDDIRPCFTTARSSIFRKFAQCAPSRGDLRIIKRFFGGRRGFAYLYGEIDGLRYTEACASAVLIRQFFSWPAGYPANREQASTYPDYLSAA